ncbi:hypothetical protein [Desulfobulbus propionicus]|nr:hypothetical protein [Desulfobulbus propionicus]
MKHATCLKLHNAQFSGSSAETAGCGRINLKNGVIMYPDKVVITITADGETVEIFQGGKVVSSRSTEMISAGEARAKQKGDIYDDLPEDFDDLAEEIEGVSLGTFGIASQLYLIKEYFE